MESIYNELMVWLQQSGIAEEYALWLMRAVVVLSILLLVYVLDTICRKAIIPIIRKVTSKTQMTWDEHLLNDEVLNNACHLIPPAVFYLLIPLAFPEESEMLEFIFKICYIYIVIAAMKLICSFISSLYTLSNEHEKLKEHTLKGFYQMLKLVVVCVGVIIIIATLIDRSPLAILTGLGAGAAILMLVFQDMIKGLVAGVQLTANDMLRPGDWITVPKYGADGDVIDVSLTTVKVRNWDKTITTVPPYALVNDSFQNWRGMFDIGGRRVKRSINIDMHSIRFCTSEEMSRYRQQPWMEGFEETGSQEVNLYVFRKYVEYYLRHHPKVNQELLLIVRQLQPTADGLPLELYFFSADTMWVKYEALQSEVFDHVLAVIHDFDLRVFQSPSGLDLQSLSHN